MKILWLTWKDSSHPEAGGAEVVNEALAGRLVASGHEVRFIVGGFAGAKLSDIRDGYTITRLGNRYTVYLAAWRYIKRHLRTWPDLVIDEVNTVPFFAGFYSGARTIMFFHMLCREIWFYQMAVPFSVIGYVIEPFYLRLLSGFRVITISNSTRLDLLRFGFSRERIAVISEGIALNPVASLRNIEKSKVPVMLSLGSVRSMKRTLDQLKAFELAKPRLPKLILKVAGSLEGRYAKRFVHAVQRSKFRDDIKLLGRVSSEDKVRLLQESSVICVTSVKEGWGLIVTEAASQGTPAIVYDVDGLRDSVRAGQTGLVVPSSAKAMAEGLVELLTDASRYDNMRTAAWQWSKEISFDRAFKEFEQIINHR